MAQTLYVTSGGTVVAQNAAVTIAANAVVTSGSTALVGATVSVSSNFVTGQDVLGINGTTSGTDGSISYSYNATSGILTLAGAESAANYQVTLRKVTYTNTAALPNSTARVITFSLNSALPFTGNGHFYEFVSSTNILWTNANTAANLRTYFGLQGYLATITSLNENTFVYSKINAAGWLGGSDATSEGVWKWVCGPENGTQFWQGGVGGTAVGGNFTYWATTPSAQPDNAFAGGEHYLCFWEGDHWNDYANSAIGSIAGYVVEYGGMVGDPVLHISDNVTAGFAPLVRDLVITGTGIKWYDAATGGNLLPATTVLVNGQHYYGSQTINGVESTLRFEVTASVTPCITAPSLTTSAATSIGATTVTYNGDITSINGANVTTRGFKYSTTNGFNPATTGTNISVTGSYGTGTFTLSPTGLTSSTTYYVCAYATNSAGTTYGTQVSFTTTMQTDFSSIGSEQSFIVPATGNYKLEVWGAQGGTAGDAGGLGGYASGTIVLTAGQTVYIYVGQLGKPPSGGTAWNGGGAGICCGGGGGGCTDIRIGGTALSNRVIVAGGGGGGSSDIPYGPGGAGGGSSGVDGNSGLGGTQSSGYALGTGESNAGDAAGGGGGYHGGYAGHEASGGSGGGGSGYIGGVTSGSTTSGERSGEGFARITPVVL